MLKKEEIDDLLLLYLLHESDPQTARLVEAWIQEKPEHLDYFLKFRSTHIRLSQTVLIDAVTGDFSAWQKKARTRRSIHRLSRVAAMILLLLGIGSTFYWKNNSPLPESSPLAHTVIQPGSSQAILHLSSGQSYRLKDNEQKIKENDGTMIAFSTRGSLRYSRSSGQRNGEELTNRLEIPRGGEFQLTLADGTQVWLNAESELQYPPSFSDKERVVRLKGEAYFKVAKNNHRPFIVQIDEMAVKVYGTQFNISTHEQNKIETVLVEGQVSIICRNQEKMLKPSQKATFIPENGEIFIDEVDVLPYTAWKDGNFVFHNEELGSIMDKLARWYDLNVFYARPEKKGICFTGILERYRNVDELFHHFEKISDVHFVIHDKTVIIE